MTQWDRNSEWDEDIRYRRGRSSRRNSTAFDKFTDTTSYQDGSLSSRIPLESDDTPEILPLQKFWLNKRHLTNANPNPHVPLYNQFREWRLQDKLKTSHGALVVCLNLDVDPPDVVKTQPCAVLECWIDPRTMVANKALEAIGRNLHQQFVTLCPRIKYKPFLDPSLEETKKFCQNLRRSAKDERILFYYNGHGVPKPTASGELWVFNRNYSQYIPVSLYEVMGWLGSPVIYIWDCSSAGHLLNNLQKFALKRDVDANTLHGGNVDGSPPHSHSIQLAACLAHETLPMAPDLPADLFTSCLTSPIETALRFFYLHNKPPVGVTLAMCQEMPGDLKDRRTPLGELNWIFTAVTDTIAWTTFPRDVFQRLYRQDLLLAALFRNFLLAERIMRNYHCTPHTIPPLPSTATHLLWAAWDRAVEEALKQLPDLVRSARPPEPETIQLLHGHTFVPEPYKYDYKASSFFVDQLTAFELWISRGGGSLTKPGPRAMPPIEPPPSLDATSIPDSTLALVPRKPPDQLPILLQVLLSQHHRTRALLLLCSFVDLGPWAVHLVLEIGMNPYVLKLLLSPQAELKPLLIYIWSRLIAYDQSCQADLMRENNFAYFMHVLDPSRDVHLANSFEHRAMCASIIAGVCRDNPSGKAAVLNHGMLELCTYYLNVQDFLLKQWALLCIAQLWDGNDATSDAARAMAAQQETYRKLATMVEEDDSPEVRSAALYALSTFLGASGSSKPGIRGGGGTGSLVTMDETEHINLEFACAVGAAKHAQFDASPAVRKEFIVLLSCVVQEWKGYFVVAAWIYWEEERRAAAIKASTGKVLENVLEQAMQEWENSIRSNDLGTRQQHKSYLSIVFRILTSLYELALDPHAEVSAMATTIVDYIMAMLLESPFAKIHKSTVRASPLLSQQQRERARKVSTSSVLSRQSSTSNLSSMVAPASSRPVAQRSDSANQVSTRSSLTDTLKRTSSFASTIKSLASYASLGHAAQPETAFIPPSPVGSSVGDGERIDSRPPSPAFNLSTYIPPYSQYPPLEIESSESASSRAPSSPSSTISSIRSLSLHSLRSASPSPNTNGKVHGQQPTNPLSIAFSPGDIVCALIGQDLLQFHQRKTRGESHAPSRPRGRDSQRVALCDQIDLRKMEAVKAAFNLDLASGLADVLPLKSRFYDWCLEYYKEAQMRHSDDDEPGSLPYARLMWLKQRNDQIASAALAQAQHAPLCEWDRSIYSFKLPTPSMKMVFHQYDPHLAMCDEGSTIRIWDWRRRAIVAAFNNGNAKGTSITSLSFVNEDTGGLLLAGSADGMVRLYRNYDPVYGDGKLELVSAWRALSIMTKVTRRAGMVTDWNQNLARLLVGGDSDNINCWDAVRECVIFEASTNASSPVTSIVSNYENHGRTFVAGFGSGTIKVFDTRAKHPDSVILRNCREHRSWIVNVCSQTGGTNELMSGSVDGHIQLWDLRAPSIAVERWDIFPEGLAHFDVHPRTNVFAATSSTAKVWRTQTVSLYSVPYLHSEKYPYRYPLLQPPTKSTRLSRISVPSGLQSPSRAFPSAFYATQSSFVFHPNEMLYSLGLADGTVKLMGCKLGLRSDGTNGITGTTLNGVGLLEKSSYLDDLI